jgi:hypothetical protein
MLGGLIVCLPSRHRSTVHGIRAAAERHGHAHGHRHSIILRHRSGPRSRPGVYRRRIGYGFTGQRQHVRRGRTGHYRRRCRIRARHAHDHRYVAPRDGYVIRSSRGIGHRDGERVGPRDRDTNWCQHHRAARHAHAIRSRTDDHRRHCRGIGCRLRDGPGHRPRSCGGGELSRSVRTGDVRRCVDSAWRDPQPQV